METWVKTETKEYSEFLKNYILRMMLFTILYLFGNIICINQINLTSPLDKMIYLFMLIFLYPILFSLFIYTFKSQQKNIKQYDYHIKEGDLVSIKTEYTFNEMKDQSNLKKLTIQKIDIEKQKVLLFQKEDKLFSEVSIDDLEKSYEKSN